MATIGNPDRPGGSWHAASDPYWDQEADLLEMPARGELLSLGAWLGGWNGTCRGRLCVWDAVGTLLGQSAQFTVANEGGGGPPGSNVERYESALETPVELAKGAGFYVGFNRHPADGLQVSLGPSGGTHYHGKSGATWPNDLGNSGGISSEPRRVGAYVANYEQTTGAHVYRSGAWTEAESVQEYRSGAWVESDAVQLWRSGALVDAE